MTTTEFRKTQSMKRQAHLDLPAEPQSARRARSFLTEMLEVWESEDPERTAELLTGELVSNAVRYASRQVSLDLTLDPDRLLTVGAIDDHPELPDQRPPSDNPSGRGIRLVDALARRWGVERREGVKLVWFELFMRPRRPS